MLKTANEGLSQLTSTLPRNHMGNILGRKFNK